MPVTVSVTYRAPKGDSKVCELFGRTFFDGQAVEIEDTPENEHAIAKLSRNRVFEVAKKAAGKLQARMHKPEPEPEPPEPDPEPVPEPEPIEEEEQIEKPAPKRAAPAQQKPAKRNAPWLKRRKR